VEKCNEVPTLYVDNASTVKLTKDPEFQTWSKHTEVRYCFVHECYQDGRTGVEHINGLKQLRIKHCTVFGWNWTQLHVATATVLSSTFSDIYVCVCVCVCVYIYIYVCVCVCVCARARVHVK